MKSLTFREGDTVEFGKGEITQAEAAIFSKLKKLPENCLTVELDRIRFGPFCGVLRAGNITIELLPKIEYQDEADEKYSRNLFIKMLRATDELRLKNISIAALSDQYTHLLDIFIFDFCNEVQRAFQGGVIYRYIEHTENLRAIRGRIHMTEHLCHNAFDESRIFCQFDEYTIDNSYNHILKNVLRRLFDYCLSMRTRTAVTTLLHHFDEVTDRPVRAEEIDNLKFDRMNEHWEEVFVRAKKLLENLFPDIKIGDSSGSALLFNMGQLFEKLLGVRLRQECSMHGRMGLSVKPHDSTHHLATLTEFMNDSGLQEKAFRLQPDFTVFEHSNCVSILDAKWKRLDTSESKFKVSSTDAYQMATYASQYGCKNIALIYPAFGKYKPCKKIASYEFKLPNDFNLSVITVNLNDLANYPGLATKSNKPSALRDFFPS